MKYIATLLSMIVMIGCSTTQSNIQVDSIETFNLDNYNDFHIKINSSNISAEINPIVLEKFRENLKKCSFRKRLKLQQRVKSYFRNQLYH